MTPWLAVAVVIAVLGVLSLASAFVALARLRIARFVTRLVLGLVLLLGAGMTWVLTSGLDGVEALTREEVAARIRVVPTGPQSVDAIVHYPDGRTATYVVFGDQLYVDAHILKWKPVMNWLGLHTSYRLDRIGGRYRDVAQEATARRTVYALRPGADARVDLVALRERLPLPMAWIVDAEYGSGVFVPVVGPADLEVSVSTSGLVLRPRALP